MKTCGNCFQETINEYGICTACGYNNVRNKDEFPLALPTGSILYGQYIIGKVLGQGGFGITYLAQNYQTKELVAIKEFFPGAMATRTGTTVVPYSGVQGENFAYGKNTFLEEAQTMAQFNGNPNIAGVQLYFEENGTAYFIMEYLDGCSFGEYIAKHGGHLSWDDTARVMLPVLEVLGQIHDKGIIHRDVSPDNIYITKDGLVKLLDFGAARHSLGNVSQSLDVVIKHGFAPKEQYSRRGRQGPFTDVYAASATIYYALTGVKPDESIDRAEEDTMPPPSILGAKISEQLENVIMKGLSVDAKDRYQSAAELGKALNTSDKKQKTPPKVFPKSQKRYPGVPTQEKRPLAQKEIKRILLGVGIVAILCIVIFWCFHPHKYSDWVVVAEATCEEDGYKEKQCFCGKTQTEVIPKSGHVEVIDTGFVATYTSQGLTDGSHCSVCMKILQPQTVIDTLKVPVMAAQTKHLYDDDLFWGTPYFNSSVKTVSFKDTMDGAPANAYDISENRDGSILCWMSGSELIVAANGKIAANPDSSYLFCNLDNLEEIHFNNCFDTSNVTDMSEMFCYCRNLKELDLSCFDTSKVTDMSNMFQGCYITALDISNFDTSNVTTMAEMFRSTYITDLDVSHFDTSKVTSMKGMFYGCHTRSLDLSGFDTSKVTSMMEMFAHCYVCDFDVSGWDTSNVTSMEGMFSYFMEKEDITFGIGSKTNFDRSFLNNTNVTKLDLSQFDTSNVKTMADMFFGCNLSSFDLSSFNTSNVTDMYSMFEWCQRLTTLDLSHFDTSNVTNMARMFLGCLNLKTLDISNFSTDSIVSSKYSFSIPFGSTKQRYGFGVEDMFNLCDRLKKPDSASELILETYQSRTKNN